MEMQQLEEVTIKFAGNSGDGMQLMGAQFTEHTALQGHDYATFPDFPAEIRAPAGTLAGVSGFKIHFGGKEIYTPGDEYDVLVAMNAAALKASLHEVKRGGTIILNAQGFDSKNLKLAAYTDNPVDQLKNTYHVISVDITELTRKALADSPRPIKQKDQSKNFFALGLLYWMYDRNLEDAFGVLDKKFDKDSDTKKDNKQVLKAGYQFGEITELISTQKKIQTAPLPPGTYRNISGNVALAIGLITASHLSKLPLFYGSYPITPASDILHELAKRKNYGVKTFQAEDEIAAVSAAIGASYGGALGATGTSGPGMALKSEAINLAVMLELPLVVIDVQRAGPSTGMPTKTEQSDLLFALYGRSGESPVPILSAKTPSDCFYMAIEASRIAIEHMTPVILLSDGYLANGAEPWKYPSVDDIRKIIPPFVAASAQPYKPYARNKQEVRAWAVPGMQGFEHRIGGLEKEKETGNVSYQQNNHEQMVRLRAKKIQHIAKRLPKQEILLGPSKGSLLVLGWGSTYGTLYSAIKELIEGEDQQDIAYTHVSYINPFPENMEKILSNYDVVVIPEINNGQLIKRIKSEYAEVQVKGIQQTKGRPFQKKEIMVELKRLLKT